MVVILLVTFLLLNIMAAIRSKDPWQMAMAIIGLVLAVLHCMGVVHVGPRLELR